VYSTTIQFKGQLHIVQSTQPTIQFKGQLHIVQSTQPHGTQFYISINSTQYSMESLCVLLQTKFSAKPEKKY